MKTANKGALLHYRVACTQSLRILGIIFDEFKHERYILSIK